MKALILAAGRGTRLAPLTNFVPKCMVKYQGKSIIDYELSALKNNGINDIGIVCGYLSNVLRNYLKNEGLKFYTNDNFMNTNMVYTMFCANELMQECLREKQDLIVSYADIIYQDSIIQKLIHHKGELGVIIDKDWEDLWAKRFENPLSDAETLKISKNKIIEIGKKPHSLSEIQGQYIGLFKFSYQFLGDVLEFYSSMDRNILHDGKDFDNMYMTSFLQALIDKYHNAAPINIHRGWTEIDNLEDLKICL